MTPSAALVVTLLFAFAPGAALVAGASPLECAGGQASQAGAPAANEHQHDRMAEPKQDSTIPAPAQAGHEHGSAPVAKAELDQLLARMEKARGSAKVAIMADLIKRLVAEHQQSAVAGGPSASPGQSAGGAHSMACPMCASHGGDTASGGPAAKRGAGGSCAMMNHK